MKRETKLTEEKKDQNNNGQIPKSNFAEKCDSFRNTIKKYAGPHANLAKLGFIPLQPDDPFFEQLHNLFSDVCYSRMSESHDSITIVKKRDRSIRREACKIQNTTNEENKKELKSSYEVISCVHNSLVNLVTNINDFHISNYSLSRFEAVEFEEQLKSDPQRMFTIIAEKTRLTFSKKEKFKEGTASLFKVNEKIFCFSIMGEDEIESERARLQKKLFLISSNQIGEIFNLPKPTSASLLKRLNAISPISVVIEEEGDMEMAHEIFIIDDLCKLIESNKGQNEVKEIIKKMDLKLLVKPNSCDFTALHVAAKKNNQDLVELLIGKGLKIDTLDKDGRTALHHAVINKCEDKKLLEMLAKNGKQKVIDVRDNKGNSALNYAVMYSNLLQTEILANCGAARRLPKDLDKGYFINDIFVDAINHQNDFKTLSETLKILTLHYGIGAVDEIVKYQSEEIIKRKNITQEEKDSLMDLLNNPEKLLPEKPSLVM